MPTLILCGGKGTRAYPHTLEVPKPLMNVGDVPILRHLMEIFAGQGFEQFVLAGGYLIDQIDEFSTNLPRVGRSTWSTRVRIRGRRAGSDSALRPSVSAS